MAIGKHHTSEPFFSSGESVIKYVPAHPLHVNKISTAITLLPWHHTSPLPSLSLPRTDIMSLLVLWQSVHGKSGQNIMYHGRGRPGALKRGRKVVSFPWYLLKLFLKLPGRKNKRSEKLNALETNCTLNYIMHNH